METYELEGDSRLTTSNRPKGKGKATAGANPILISSDEEDIDGIAFVGTSRVLIKPSKQTIAILDDSSSDDDRLPDLQDALKSKGHSSPYAKPSRALDEERRENILPKPKKRKSEHVEKKPKASSRQPRISNDDDAILRKEAREAEKKLEKEKKELAKAQAKFSKAEKEAQKSLDKKIAEVNRLRTSKNDAVREIEIHFSHDLSLPTSAIAAALPEIKARFHDNRCKWHFDDEDDSPFPGLLRFKRHVQARWDLASKRFVPLDTPRWEWEKAIILVATVEDIVDRISQGSTALAEWISDLRIIMDLSVDTQVMLLVKGLNKYFSKTKTLDNRDFTAAARAGLSDAGLSRSTATTDRLEKDAIDRALVELQLQQTVFIVRVERAEDIEDWIWNLAADVAVRPYKLLSKSHLSFAPSDHPRKASTSTDALELMLEEVLGVTASAASGIASRYPTFAELMEAFELAETAGGVDKAELLLADCDIKNLRNGAPSGRKLNKSLIPQALARKVFQALRGEDSLALA